MVDVSILTQLDETNEDVFPLLETASSSFSHLSVPDGY